MNLKEALAAAQGVAAATDVISTVTPEIAKAVTEAVVEKATENAVVITKEETALAVCEEMSVIPVQKTPLEILADKKMAEIRKLNPDFKLDFMNVFTRMKTNTKGQFMYSLSGEDFVLSDKIPVRLLAGEYMHQCWGKKDSEREGELVCYSKDGQITNVDGHSCAQCPYDKADCRLRFAVALQLLIDTEDPDEIYNFNMPQTGAFAFADYVKLVTKKLKVGLKDVKTVMYTEEKEGAEKGQKYNAILFKLGQ